MSDRLLGGTSIEECVMTTQDAKVGSLLRSNGAACDRREDAQFLVRYFERYREVLFGSAVTDQLIELKEMIQETSQTGKKVVIVGNGGSAAIAAHGATDLSKNAKVRCICFHDASLITCLANDFGYEHWVEAALSMYADKGDLIILLSSSGKSPNMVRAADYARGRGLRLVTFTGFAPTNALRQCGDLNLWVDSRAYNIVENTHQIWLLAVCDLLIGDAEYPASPPAEAALTALPASNF